MKVLYTGLQAENYDPKRKYSFEYNNFFLTLKHMPGVEVIEYPFDPVIEIGKKAWNEKLWELVEKEKPDVLFAFMYTDELDPNVVERITRTTTTKTIAWFADDYWRFFNYSKNWAAHFSYVVTTYYKAVEWYKNAGHDNVILSQWAYNPAVSKRLDMPQDISVSFIGQYKFARALLIRELAKKGIHVEAYGTGWPNGRPSHDEMLRVIARSKINLNLNTRQGLLNPSVIGRIILRKTRNTLRPDLHLADNLRAYFHFPTLHTHARPFELAGAGGFTISGYSDGLEKYYVENREMVFSRSTDDLAEKIAYYLAHDDERLAIREAGYARTVNDHTYEKRLKEIFERAMIKAH